VKRRRACATAGRGPAALPGRSDATACRNGKAPTTSTLTHPRSSKDLTGRDRGCHPEALVRRICARIPPSMGSTARSFTKFLAQAPVAQLDRAPDYESGGQEFESLRARQHYTGPFHAPGGAFALYQTQGSITFKPQSEKSSTLRVAKDARRDRTMAAIRASPSDIGRPAWRRLAAMSAYSRAAELSKGNTRPARS
jgi:hypothetical protein